MKRISETAQASIAHYESEINNARNNMGSLELAIVNILLNEKLLMNIPPMWPYDMDAKMFVHPDQVGGRPVVEMGPTKLLVIKPNR